MMSTAGDDRAFLVFFEGRVQGVGFRFTAVRVAERFDVRGYVRNLPDGRVELWAQGRGGEAAAFIHGVEEAMARQIATSAVTAREPNSRFTDFQVRY